MYIWQLGPVLTTNGICSTSTSVRGGLGGIFFDDLNDRDEEMLLSLLFLSNNKLGIPKLLLVLLPFRFSYLEKNKLGVLLLL